MTTENAKDNGDFAAIERAAHKAWMDSKHMESSDPYCCFIDGFHAGRSQPSEWVAKAPVEAIRAAVAALAMDQRHLRGDAETIREARPETYKRYMAEHALMGEHIESLRALLPPNAEAKS